MKSKTGQSSSKKEPHHDRKNEWEKVLADLESTSTLDLSFLDDLGDEPIRDEALKLPYEYTEPN